MSTTPSASTAFISPVTTSPPDVVGGPDTSLISLPVAEAAEDWVDAASELVPAPVGANIMPLVPTLFSLANDSGSKRPSALARDDETEETAEEVADGIAGAREVES